MTGTGALKDKRKLAALSLIQLTAGVSEDSGAAAVQIVLSPSSAEFPKRTLTFGLADLELFCGEMEAVVALIRAYAVTGLLEQSPAEID